MLKQAPKMCNFYKNLNVFWQFYNLKKFDNIAHSFISFLRNYYFVYLFIAALCRLLRLFIGL
jgi:hypothetical protein